MMHGRGKSDPTIVVTKPTNKAGRPVAEPVVKPGTPDRSRRRARRAICGTPGDGQSRARDRLRRLRASSGVSVRLLGKVRDLSGRSGLSAGKGPNRDESGIP